MIILIRLHDSLLFQERRVVAVLNGHTGRVNAVQWVHRQDCGECARGGRDWCGPVKHLALLCSCETPLEKLCKFWLLLLHWGPCWSLNDVAWVYKLYNSLCEHPSMTGCSCFLCCCKLSLVTAEMCLHSLHKMQVYPKMCRTVTALRSRPSQAVPRQSYKNIPQHSESFHPILPYTFKPAADWQCYCHEKQTLAKRCIRVHRLYA